MTGKRLLGPTLFLFLLLFLLPALGETADITSAAVFSGKNKSDCYRMSDDNYRTVWKSGKGSSAYLEVTLPEDRPCGTVYIQWYGEPMAFRVLVPKDGGWTVLCRKTEAYYSSALTFPVPSAHFRICPADDGAGTMSVAEIRLYAPGPLPENVQVWLPTVEKADLMLVSCHPDDEVLWFGGALATYAGERQKDVVVCLMVPTSAHRRLEFLDSLWTCGVRTYPVFGTLTDLYSTSLKAQYTLWSEQKCLKTVTGWFRRFQPSVVLSHDIHGEYGHGGHRVCADICIKALKTAADAGSFPESALEWGTWDVPKLYLHLYEGGAITMPWDTPLEHFGGKTGLEVAKEAFKCHISQQSTHYAVNADGRYACTRFGLYRSLVGDDEMQNDFFEHLDPGYCPFEVVDDED